MRAMQSATWCLKYPKQKSSIYLMMANILILVYATMLTHPRSIGKSGRQYGEACRQAKPTEVVMFHI